MKCADYVSHAFMRRVWVKESDAPPLMYVVEAGTALCDAVIARRWPLR